MNDPIYLDNHTVAKPFSDVLDTLFRSHKEYWAVSGTPHFLGQQLEYPKQKSLDSLSKTLGSCEDDLWFFHSGSAEGVREVLLSTYFEVSRETGKTLFLTGPEEETATLSSLSQLEEMGCLSKSLPVNDKGQISSSSLLSAITPKTALLSISWANGLTGVIQPIEDLAAICAEKKILFHVDASYVLGKRFFRFQDLQIDFLTVDGSVIHAPQGVGFTLIKKGSPFLMPKRPMSIPSMASLAHASYEVHEKFEHYCFEISRLRDLLESRVVAGFPSARVLFKEVDRLPDSSLIAFPGVYAEALLYLLNAKGVYASCGGGKFQSLEKILSAMGIDFSVASAAISFSLPWDITEEEVEMASKIIVECAAQIRTCSLEVYP